MQPSTVVGPRTQRRTRSIRAWLLALVVIVVLLAAAAGAGAWYLRPAIASGEQLAITAESRPTLSLELEHAWGLDESHVSAAVGGASIASGISVDGGTITFRAPRLRDGEHEVVVTVTGLGALRTTLERRWSLTVDTTDPKLMVAGKRGVVDATIVPADVVAIRSKPAALQVSTEADASVTAAIRGRGIAGERSVTARANERGFARLTSQLADGMYRYVVTSTDRAGNESRAVYRALVDATKPRVRVAVPRAMTTRELEVPVTATDVNGVIVAATLNGSEEAVRVVDADGVTLSGGAADDEAAEGEEESASDDTADDEAPVDEEDGAQGEETADDEEDGPVRPPNRFVATIVGEDDLLDGRHLLELTVRDGAGNEQRIQRRFTVETSEVLGETGLRGGARGADVRELQTSLVNEKITTKAVLGREWVTQAYGPATLKAVRNYQGANGLDADGVAGESTIARLTLRIEIDRSTHTLTLYRGSAVVKTYGVAVGAPEFPTPTGSFEIVDMQRNPTWTPPNSDWAKGAKPIGPGPNNPLGTRWMGINSPAVGIHGTPNPASIGYSQSHGCIRMRIPEVEELFEIVEIGTPVEIV